MLLSTTGEGTFTACSDCVDFTGVFRMDTRGGKITFGFCVCSLKFDLVSIFFIYIYTQLYVDVALSVATELETQLAREVRGPSRGRAWNQNC